MKKSLFFAAAASAFMLTACSSENDVVQSPTNQNTVVAEQQAVGFDIYTPAATNARRAGYEGVMTTPKLKLGNDAGFGVFAFYSDGADYNNSADKPNFMFNQQVKWSSGWTYTPLKYWPNETIQDSQNATTPGTYTDPTTYACDKISFFTYAPYVDLTKAGNMTVNTTGPVTESAYVEASPSSGILAITKEDKTGDPLVEWKAKPITSPDDLDEQVDLLWGVAPNGMAYQSVNPDIYINKPFGLPLTNMVKPNKDQKMKFLFQHALSRIGLSVVSAIDQIAAGDDGGVYSNAETRVLIKSVEIYGDFGTQGVLNLNNGTANVANWIPASIDYSSVTGAALYTFTAANGAIAKDLRYEGLAADGAVKNAANAGAAKTAFDLLNTGVLSSEKPLLAQGVDPSKEALDLTYAVGKKLYKQSVNDYVRATTTSTSAVDVFKKVGNDWVQIHKSASGKITLNGDEEAYYTLTPTSKTGTEVAAATVGTTFFIKTTDGSTGLVTYTRHLSTGSETDSDGNDYYALADTPLAVDPYTGTCYTELTPRYFMVIPTGTTPVKVKITYAVVTYDAKLTGYVSDVENEITKEVSVNLENGKSYNLKLILGLTSVKLDATVADWQVADDTEIWLPQNNE